MVLVTTRSSVSPVIRISDSVSEAFIPPYKVMAGNMSFFEFLGVELESDG